MPDIVEHHGMMSQSVVLECQQGSEVWLQADTTLCYVIASDKPASLFNGFILTP